MSFGLPVTATVFRKPGTVVMGQTSSWTLHLTITCRSNFGTLLEPISSFQVQREYGITGNVNQPHLVMADWPAGATEDYPVQPGDKLTLPQGSYDVKGVKCFPGKQMELIVEVPFST